MKKLVIVVLVVAVLLAVAPFGIGKLAEKRINASLDKSLADVPFLKIVDRKWTGGWFRSEQVLTFEFTPPGGSEMSVAMSEETRQKEVAEAAAAMDAENTDQGAADAVPPADADAAEAPMPESAPEPAKPQRFTVRNHVLHGPVLGLSGIGLARVDSDVDLPPDVIKGIKEVFGEKPAMTMSTRVHFFGGATTTIESEGRSIKPPKSDTEIVYDTFKLSVGFGKNLDSYDVDGKWPKLVVKGKNGGDFTLTNLTIDGAGDRVRGELYDGDFAFKVDEMKYEGEFESQGFLMKDLHYIVDSDTDKDYSSMSAKIGTGEFVNKDFESLGLKVKEIHYNFSLRHLHADSLEKIMAAYKNGYMAIIKDPAHAEATMFDGMKEPIEELLNHDPELSFDRVGLVTADGEAVIKGLIKFVGVTPRDFSAPSGMGLVSKMDVDVTIEAAEKLVASLPNGEGVEGAVAAGYVKRDGGTLSCHIVFKNGNLTINGKSQGIPGLGGPRG